MNEVEQQLKSARPSLAPKKRDLTECNDCALGRHDRPGAFEHCVCLCCHPDPYPDERRAGMRSDLLAMIDRAAAHWTRRGGLDALLLIVECTAFAHELSQRNAPLKQITGKWPGEETIEEILEALN